MTFRIVAWLLALVFLAAAVWQIVHLGSGDGVSVSKVLGLVVTLLLGVVCLLGAVVAGRYDAVVDADTATLHVKTLGERALPLDEPTRLTIELRRRSSAQGTSTGLVWHAVFQRAGEAKIDVNEPYERDFRGFVASLQPVLAAHPQLAADERTRAYIEDPARLDEDKEAGRVIP